MGPSRSPPPPNYSPARLIIQGGGFDIKAGSKRKTAEKRKRNKTTKKNKNKRKKIGTAFAAYYFGRGMKGIGINDPQKKTETDTQRRGGQTG